MGERTRVYQVLCALGWHRWPQWSDRYEVKIVTVPVNAWTGDPLPCGPMQHVHERQSRACLDCGKSQVRRVR